MMHGYGRLTTLRPLAWLLLLTTLALTAAETPPARFVVVHDAGSPANTLVGPTGARGLVLPGRLVVDRVAAGSPGDGLLLAHDWIVGVGETRFDAATDLRRTLGQAITQAESTAGQGGLRLRIRRDGMEREVLLQLPVLGDYSESWPRDCEKSDRVLTAACDFLAATQNPTGGGMIGWNPLIWLASGEPGYLANARLAAYAYCDQIPELGQVLNNWHLGYRAVFLAEYYLGTGDATVLPALGTYAERIAAGQMLCGSWGHTSPWDGYGAVNQIGLINFMALLLAREAGVPVDATAVARSTAFFARFTETGTIPYGDHPPYAGGLGNNGVHGSASVCFALLGDRRASTLHARVVCAAYQRRERGHTGPFFSFFWGMAGATQAPAAEYQRLVDYWQWYYDLGRDWEGGLRPLPTDEGGTYSGRGSGFTTGGMGLFLAAPRQEIRILGAAPGVFGRPTPAALETAARLYHDQRWADCDAELTRLAAATDLDATAAAYREALRAAREAMEAEAARCLEQVQAMLDAGDVYRAQAYLTALERRLGERRPAMAELAARLATPAAARGIAAGQEYWRVHQVYHERQRREMRAVVKMRVPYYSEAAKERLARVPGAPKNVDWQAVVPALPTMGSELLAPVLAEAEPAANEADLLLELEGGSASAAPGHADQLDVLAYGWQDGPPPAGAFGVAHPASALSGQWQAVETPVTGETRQLVLRKTADIAEPAKVRRLRLQLRAPRDAWVYLNGELVAEILHGSSDELITLELHPKATTLLRQGRNAIAIHCSAAANAAIDVDLQGELAP